MPYQLALEIEQAQRDIAADAAEEMYIGGEMDGYDGVKPVSRDYPYFQGYIAGSKRKLAQMQQDTDWLLTVDTEINQMLDDMEF